MRMVMRIRMATHRCRHAGSGQLALWLGALGDKPDGADMLVTLGTAQYTYEVAEPWAQLPEGWSFREVAAVGVDAQDQVYAFNRGAHPMMVFDREGHFLRSWGEGVFTRAHGMTMGPDATMFCTDDGDHTVRKCTLEGKVLFTLGYQGSPPPL
jgi:hypothetical protein